MAGKKRYFPGRVGNIPGEAGKNSSRKRWTIDGGTVVWPDSIKQGKNHIEYSDVLARLSNLAMKYRQIRLRIVKKISNLAMNW